MSGNNNQEDALFDDLEAEEERLAAAEQAELDAADAEEANEEAKPENTVEALFSLIDKLKLENEELKDKVLRTAAEMENLRRRTSRDVADARNYSTSNFARDMLSVGDNLNRAIEALPDEMRTGNDANLKSLIEGVEMTEREMINALEKNGVKKIDPMNEKFDPNFHQAIFEVPNPEVPNNTIINVAQHGYIIGGRVLRPAMVGIAKGGPKIVAVEEPAVEENPETDTESAQ